MSDADKLSLVTTAGQLIEKARAGSSGRASANVYGGHDRDLHQTLIALVAGASLSEHESPGEATLVVIQGRIRLLFQDVSSEAESGELLVVPPTRHSVEAIEDAAFLLTVAQRRG